MIWTLNCCCLSLSLSVSVSVLLRSHSVPHRKEVRVQLLDPEPLQTTTVPQGPPDTAGGMVGPPEAGLSSGHLGHASDSAAAAAAATAAAVAAAAPLIKVGRDAQVRT